MLARLKTFIIKNNINVHKIYINLHSVAYRVIQGHTGSYRTAYDHAHHIRGVIKDLRCFVSWTFTAQVCNQV